MSERRGDPEAEDPAWLAWEARRAALYDRVYYRSNPLVSYINRSGHALVERFYREDERIGTVLELGAGSGEHLDHVRHPFDRWIVSDLRESMLAIARGRAAARRNVEFRAEDATALSLADSSVDRLVSVYTLEHLLEPHLVLREWRRVVRPGGSISLAIPCEGGIAWRLGRRLTTRRTFAREGLDLDYIIAREHVNPCYNLVALIRHQFPRRRETWYPFGFPSCDLNLVYACRVEV